MSTPIEITDSTLDSVLHETKPVMILITNGEGLRGDFKVAYQKAAADAANKGVMFAQLDPTKNPLAAARLNATDKPVLVGWYCGEEVVRRSRPWGSDLPLALESIQKEVTTVSPVSEEPVSEAQLSEEPVTEPNKPAVIYDAPVAVTDTTFEEEVLQYTDSLVMVDFWAPWCGPCRQVAPALDKLAKEFSGKVKIAKVNTDENPALSQAFQIRSIPTLMMIKNRTMIFNQPGAMPEHVLRDLIQKGIELDVPTPPEQPEQPEEA